MSDCINDMTSTLEIECSLNYNMSGMETFVQAPVAIIVTVDSQNVLRMYSICGEQSEMVM